MEQDVLRRLAGESKSGCINSNGNSKLKGKAVGGGVALAAVTHNWWSQLKTAGAAIYANRHYLMLRAPRQPILDGELICPPNERLHVKGCYSKIGFVYVHPSAKVHPTALVSYILLFIYCFLSILFQKKIFF
jgi:mannose-1-phosphate guanylyltransferase